VECAGEGAAAVLDGLRAGRVAITARREGPILLRTGGELLAIDAEGTILTGPLGPRARVAGPRQAFADQPGYHRLTDHTGATLALVG
jgi:hypothetical protein